MSEAFAKIDALFKREVGKDGPGAALAVLQNGELVYKNAWGLASIENPLPLTTHSIFNTGSIAKIFTAYAILHLQQQRKLNLEDELRKHIPEFPYYGIPTRLRHLLWHTSGIRCYTTLGWWGGVPHWDDLSRKQALEMVCRQKELNFASGSEYLYGNSNYLLLSEVAQRVSGKSIGQLLKALVFDPMGMKATHFREWEGLPIPGLVQGHWDKGAAGFRIARGLGSVPGVGRLMSSVEDLARFEQFFIKPRKQELGVLRSMLTQGWLDNGQKIRYGGGLMLQRYRGLELVRHDGFTTGNRAEFCRFPSLGTSFVCMTNNTRISPTWMIRRCANLLFKGLEPVSALGPGQPAPPPARQKMSSKQLKPLEGLYRDVNSAAYLEMTSTKSGLHLRNSLTGFDLAAESPTAFQGQEHGGIYRVHFEADGGLILVKQGRASIYEKVKLPGKVPDAKLERYVGRYACPELLTRVEFKIKDGQLVICYPSGGESTLSYIKAGRFYDYFRDFHFTQKGFSIESSDAWVRRLKWVKL